MKRSLSVVVPAYNEEENIVKCLENLDKYLRKSAFDYEIIVVNDGSRDKTGEIVKGLLKKVKNLRLVEHFPNRGYGGALKAGFYAATKDLVTLAHADSQFDFSEITKFVEKMHTTNADIVSGIRVQDRDPLFRRINRWLWNKLVYALFGHLATDIDCGFKLFKKSIFKLVSLPSNGALIDTQLLASARIQGLKIEEIPVSHFPRLIGSATGANVKVILHAIKELFVYWWQLRQEIMLEQGRAVFKWEVILIGLILLIAGFTRLYKIDQYMTFLGDEGRDAMVVRDMMLGQKFTLLGPGTSIGNMYLGPLYYYMMVPSLALSGLSPVGPAIAVALLGVATVGLLWWWARQLFGRTPALLISTLYSLSPVIITYSHSSWNPNIMPFFALLTMYGVWKVWRFGYWRWLLIAAASFAFVLNSHYLGLALFPAMALFVFLAPKARNFKKYLIFAIGLFGVLMSPLFFFDLRHGWMNSKNILAFFTNRQTTVNIKIYKAIPNLWPLWAMVIDSLVAAKNSLFSVWIAVASAIGLAWVIKNKPSKDFWFVVVWVGAGLVALGLYKQHIYDHYFGFIYPAVFLLLGFMLSKLNRYLSFVICLFLIIVNLWSNPLRFPPNNQWRHTQEIADFIIERSENKPFNLALLSKGNYDLSYRYALTLKKANYKTLLEQNTDQLFTICEDPTCNPIGNPLWEIAGFGWVKIDEVWTMPWGVKVYKLGHYEK